MRTRKNSVFGLFLRNDQVTRGETAASPVQELFTRILGIIRLYLRNSPFSRVSAHGYFFLIKNHEQELAVYCLNSKLRNYTLKMTLPVECLFGKMEGRVLVLTGK